MKILTYLFIISAFTLLSYSEIDQLLQSQIQANNLSKMEKPDTDSSKVVLGQKLFFDKLLSGNKDISCATCHHPALHSADELTLPIGVGGDGLGKSRKLGYDRTHIPRNSPEVFNRGAEEWRTMFWDSRVAIVEEEFISPADEKLPEGFDNVLAVQAMFPVTSRDEMRGEIGDLDVFGDKNELALISNAAPQFIWAAILRRLLKYPEYEKMFLAAYPNKSLAEMEFQDAANAIAAFEIEAFTSLDSPWDNYLAGNLDALTQNQKVGAVLFYGKAGCVNCHSGNLMTDQEHHNIGIPQFGPGRGDAAPLDVGRFAETGQRSDRFAFRTPPLRNVATTAPYMHNGAYNNLKEAIEHHFDPASALDKFDANSLPIELRDTYLDDEIVKQKMIQSLDKSLRDPKLKLNHEELMSLVAFMEALTEKGLQNKDASVASSVPSGLSVD